MLGQMAKTLYQSDWAQSAGEIVLLAQTLLHISKAQPLEGVS